MDLTLFLISIWVGSIIFFSAIIAPTVFKALDEKNAEIEALKSMLEAAQAQAEEAKAVEEAMKVSQSTAEQDQQRHLEYERRLREEEERALQLSQEEKRTEDAERSRPQTLAGLEASLCD